MDTVPSTRQGFRRSRFGCAVMSYLEEEMVMYLKHLKIDDYIREYRFAVNKAPPNRSQRTCTHEYNRRSCDASNTSPSLPPNTTSPHIQILSVEIIFASTGQYPLALLQQTNRQIDTKTNNQLETIAHTKLDGNRKTQRPCLLYTSPSPRDS